MNNVIFTQQIKTYLAGQMGRRAEKQFEAELERNSDLKKAFLLYSIDAYEPPTSKEKETKKLVEETYQAYGAVPQPTLPLSFHLRVLWDSTWGKLLLGGGGLAVTALVAWFIVAGPSAPTPPSKQFMSSHIQDPFCPGQAALPATDIFCNGEATIPRLEQMTKDCPGGFCLAEYYLAHLYLKEAQYPKAAAAFERCIAHYEVIGAYIPKDLDVHNALIFNKILAELGEGKKSRAEIRTALEALLPQLDGYRSLRQDAQEVVGFLDKK
jgi:tetratricopeptide (TPR) repeat protein